MLVGILLVLVGLVALCFGAEWLVRGSVDVARRLRMPPLLIGLTIVALGTSAPELITGVIAVIQGKPGIVLGNAVGSNIANLGLALGLAALLARVPVGRRVAWFDGVLVLTLTGVACLLALDGEFSRPDGAVLLLMLASVTVLTVINRERELQVDAAQAEDTLKYGWLAVLFIGLGLVGLAGGAHFLVTGAVRLATALGIGDTFIGATAVALGTSAPEIAASIAAVRRKHYDIMLGNLLGSCQVNLALILGLPALIAPLPAGSDFLYLHLPALAIISLVAWAFMLTERKILRREGAVLLALYVAYLVGAYLLQ